MFYTTLDARNILNDEKNWILLAVLKYWSERFKLLITAPYRFVTDFSSVPRLPIVYALCGGRGNAPAAIHDWCYRTGCVSKNQADLMFLDGMKEIGLPWYICELMFMGVRYGGWSTWNKYVEMRAKGLSTFTLYDLEPDFS